MFRRVLSALVLVAVAAVLLLIAWPQLLGLQRETGVAQAASLRGLLLVVAVLLAALLGLVALGYRGARGFLGPVALLLAVFAAVQLAVLSTRGAGGEEFATKQSGDVTVLVWNTLGDSPPVATAVQLIVDEQADVVVLPETSLDYLYAVAAGVEAAGRPMQPLQQQYDAIAKAKSTSLLISDELGSYRLDTSQGGTDTLPSLLAVPTEGDGPTIVAAHPVAPVPGEMAAWRQGLDWLAARCTGKNVILAGDLNSTLDHYAGLDRDGSGGLGACRDAAKLTEGAAVGSWPAVLPPLLGAPIDHVMASSDWDVVGFRVIVTLDGAGSDHRPVVAQLRRAG